MINTGLEKGNPNAELQHEMSSWSFHILKQNKFYFLTSLFMKIEIYLHVPLRTC